MSSQTYKKASSHLISDTLSEYQSHYWMYSTDTDTILFSQSILTQIGFAPATTDYIDWKMLVHPDDILPTQQKISDFLASDEPVLKDTLRLKTPSGEYRYFHLRGRQIKKNEKTTLDGFCIDLPCCDMKLSHMRQTQDQAFQQSSLRALGTLASSIAHEINNPLSVIRMNAELLNVANELSTTKEKIHERSTKILNTVDHIAGIVTALKSISSSTGKLNLKWVNIGRLFDNITSLCSHKMRYASIDLNIIFESNRDEDFFVDQAQLTQAILNLISNSYDSINLLHKKWIKITISKSDLDLNIDVADSGSGIDEDVVNNMMTPFYTTKKNPTQKSEAGLGLGLSLVNSYITGHKGTVTYNLVNEHTNFRVSLPLHTVQPPKRDS